MNTATTNTTKVESTANDQDCRCRDANLSGTGQLAFSNARLDMDQCAVTPNSCNQATQYCCYRVCSSDGGSTTTTGPSPWGTPSSDKEMPLAAGTRHQRHDTAGSQQQHVMPVNASLAAEADCFGDTVADHVRRLFPSEHDSHCDMDSRDGLTAVHSRDSSHNQKLCRNCNKVCTECQHWLQAAPAPGNVQSKVLGMVDWFLILTKAACCVAAC